MCADLSMCLHVFFKSVLGGVLGGPHRCTPTPLMGPFHVWQDQQMTRWRCHIFSDPQTNHIFKRHFKRETLRKATRWGPGKSCAVFYSPSAIIQLDSLFFLRCVKCCARSYTNLAVGQMFKKQTECEKWELSLKRFNVYNTGGILSNIINKPWRCCSKTSM